jgi:hypothetical protein
MRRSRAGYDLPEQLGLRVAASPDAATMRPRAELSTDDNVKKQTRIDIVVPDGKRSAYRGQASAVGYRLLFCVTQGSFDGHAVPGTRASSGRQPGTGEGRLPHVGSAVSSRCQCRRRNRRAAFQRSQQCSRNIGQSGGTGGV